LMGKNRVGSLDFGRQQHNDVIAVSRSNIGTSEARSHQPTRLIKMKSNETVRLTMTGYCSRS
jgi:hypothetical protein